MSHHTFENTRTAKAAVLDWCYGFYNHDRRHSTIGMVSPINYETTAATEPEAAQETLHDPGGTTLVETLAGPVDSETSSSASLATSATELRTVHV